MSQIILSGEMDEFYGVLYELVSPMLASDNCVKCITQDGSDTFTSDVEHLLCSLDIEHPAGELVVQALQAHKHTFGTGTETLLFMIASLAKAITQLDKLGISSETSVRIIHNAFLELSREIKEIAIPIQECLHLSTAVKDYEAFAENSTNENGCSEIAKPGMLVRTNSGCELRERIDPFLPENFSVIKSRKAREVSNLQNPTGDKSWESLVNFQSYVNILNPQNMSAGEDDVEWFFDSISQFPASIDEAKYMLVVDHGQGLQEHFVSRRDSMLMGTLSADYGKSLDANTKVPNKKVHSSCYDLKSSYDSENSLKSTNNVYNQIKCFLNSDSSSFTKNHDHDSDFEDCFSENKPKGGLSALPHQVGQKHKENFTECPSLGVSGSKDMETISASGSKDMETVSASGSKDMETVSVSESKDMETISASGSKDMETVSEMLNSTPRDFDYKPLSFDNLEKTCAKDNDYEFSLGSDDIDHCIFSIGSESSKLLPRKHKNKNVNTALDIRVENKYHEILTLSSSYTLDSQNITQQPADSWNNISTLNPQLDLAVCENSSLNLSEIKLCQCSPENTLKHDNDHTARPSLSSFTSTCQNYKHSDSCASLMRNAGTNHLQFSSEKSICNGKTVSNTSMETFNKIADCETINFRKKSNNINRNSKSRTDVEIVLDKLLQKKKTQFKSSLVNSIRISSRHLHNDSCSDFSFTSGTSENFKETTGLCNENIVHSHFSSPFCASNSERSDFGKECENEELIHSLEKSGIATLSSLPDVKCEVTDTFCDTTNILSHTRSLSESAKGNFLSSSASCRCAHMSYSFSEESIPICPIKKLHVMTACLQDGHGDMAKAAMHIFHTQTKNQKKYTRFDLHLVDCLSLPSLKSSVSVVPGLTLPCDTTALEKLNVLGKSLSTLLISGDLTPNFHHQGYKPILAKKTFISEPHNGNEESDERLWCIKTFEIIVQLNVNLILVKGKASSILLDMCAGVGVLVLTCVSHHKLSTISHFHRVDILTYISLATETNLCSIHLQPLSSSWMDQLLIPTLNIAKDFIVITNTSDVQTVILHCSSKMSAQILEERLWKCLHSIANLCTDAQVLPGEGNTELWCADRVRYKSKSALANNSCCQPVILEAVAGIFDDYYRTVKLRNVQEGRQPLNQRKNDDQSSVSAFNFSENTNMITHKTATLSSSRREIEELLFIKDCECRQNSPWNKADYNFLRLKISPPSVEDSTDKSSVSEMTKHTDNFSNGDSNLAFKPDESQNQNVTNIEYTASNRSIDVNVYDNFQSKISAWMTALDVVSVLQSLGYLIISGLGSNDITEDEVLL